MARRILKLVRESLRIFFLNPLRTFLALLGIVFGVASVIAMMAIGAGAQKEIMQNIQAMGIDVLHIKSNPISEDILGKSINNSRGLSRSDVDAIKSITNLVDKDIGFSKSIQIHSSNFTIDPKNQNIFAVNFGFLNVASQTLFSGRKFIIEDFFYLKNVAIVGYDVAEKINKENPEKILNTFIEFDNTWWEVVGVLNKIGFREEKKDKLPLNPNRFNDAVFIPFDSAFLKTKSPAIYAELDLISIKVGSISSTLIYKDVISKILSDKHGKMEDYKIIAPEELLLQQKKTQSIFNLVLLSIAGISLLVGGIGIMNIMLANVLERVKEIGIRRAIGATKQNIMHQFLAESIGICFVGGFCGIILGIGISICVELFSDITVSFSIIPMVLAFVISVTIGIIFGILPAHRAASVEPIKALHSE